MDVYINQLMNHTCTSKVLELNHDEVGPFRLKTWRFTLKKYWVKSGVKASLLLT